MHKIFSYLKGFFNFIFNGCGHISNGHGFNSGSGDGFSNDPSYNPDYGFGVCHSGEGERVCDLLYYRRSVCGDGGSYRYNRGYGNYGCDGHGDGETNLEKLYTEESNA